MANVRIDFDVPPKSEIVVELLSNNSVVLISHSTNGTDSIIAAHFDTSDLFDNIRFLYFPQ